MKAGASFLAVLFFLLAAPALARAGTVEGADDEATVERAKELLAGGKYDAVIFTLDGVEFAGESLRLVAESTIETARLRKARMTEINQLTTARSVRLFQAIVKESATPLAKARLAEALALSSKEAEQLRGHAIFERLNKANQIPDGYGYAVLAYLRRLAGEERAARKALRRCGVMTRYKKSACKLPATFKVGKAVPPRS